jgi:hypothetical protein
MNHKKKIVSDLQAIIKNVKMQKMIKKMIKGVLGLSKRQAAP